MNAETVHTFLYGALSCAALLVAVFFVRYWSLARDRFFVFFAGAFAALATNWAWLALLGSTTEHRLLSYVIRLVAFVLILVGIVDKNRRA